MTYSRIAGFLSMAVLFALFLGAAFAERSFAQTTTTVEILATDLVDDAADKADRKDAQDKVNAKIDAATLTGGSVVTFPSGTFPDVGEILIVGKNGTAATTNPAAPAKYITFRGNNTVFTGKIMINVQDSTYITIEGFTFRDTKVPDRITVIGDLPADASDAEKDHLVIGSDVVATDAANNGDAASEMSGGIVENYRAHVGNEVGVIWLNPSVYSTTAACPASQYINNITIRGNRFENTSTHGISTKQMGSWIFGYDTDGSTAVTGIPIANYRECHSSKLVFSKNTFMGIGYNGDYLGGDKYRDGAGRVPGYKNWKGAINTGSRHVYDWTVSGNTVDGTTSGGLKVGAAFGTTLVENNVVSNTASTGITVSQSPEADHAAAAAAAKITIRNNRVTNSRNDAYFTNLFGVANPGYAGYLSIWDPGAGMLTSADYGPGMTDKAADALLKPRVFKLPKGHTRPYIGAVSGDSRLLSSIYNDHTTGYDSGGSRPDPVGGEPPVHGTSANAPGVRGNLYPYPTIVRALKPTISAGIKLNAITAGTIVVENNELTDNVVGLAVCPSYACYADGDFPSLLPATGPTSQTPAAGTLTVPTLTANRIYDNRKQTDMPREFVRADVVNALTTANVTGSNVLVLKGNYLGDSPEVRGAVNDDDLAMEDLNAGPRETVPPALPSTGGAMFTGTTVTLTYGEALDEESVPAAAAFTVTQTASGGLSGPITVSSVAVAGMSVTLTLAKAPGSGNSVTVSYDPAKAGSGEGMGPIQDAAGNAAAALSGQVVSMMPDPVDPGTGMPPTTGTEMPAAAGGDGGCALASGGKGGIDLGVLLPLMTLAALSFGLRRGSKESVAIR